MEVVRNYFLPAIDESKKAALNAQKVIFADFEMGSKKGIVLDETQLSQGLRALKKMSLAELPTEITGVFKLEIAEITGLDPEYAKGDDLKWWKNTSAITKEQKRIIQRVIFDNSKKDRGADCQVKIKDWNGEGSSRFRKLAKEILLPKIGTEIVISVPHRKHTSPAEGDVFHIRIWSAPSESGDTETQTPEKIWGTRVACDDESFAPSGQGIVIRDKRYAVAELVGENTLYIFHDLCHYGRESELTIFRKILEAVVAPEVFSQLKRFRRPVKAVEPEKKKDSKKLEGIEIDRSMVIDSGGFNSRELELVRRVYAPIISRELMTKIRRSICLHNGGGEFRMRDLPRYDNMFHIYFFAAPTESIRQGFLTPKQLWRIPLPTKSGSFQITNEGKIIYDEDGQEAGQIIAGRNLYIPFPILGADEEYKKIFKKLMQAVASLLTSTTAERQKQEAKMRTAQGQAYANTCLQNKESIIKDAKEELTEVANRVNSLQIQLVTAIRKYDALKEVADGKKKDGGVYRKQFAIDFEKMRQLEKIRKVSCIKNQLIVDTDILFCKHPRKDQIHLIGAFRIVIPLNGDCNQIRFFNLTQKIGGHNAPHVFEDGHACLGAEMEEVLPQLIARFDFMPLLIMCIVFLESANYNDPMGQHIDNWPIVEKAKK
ncbi:MAG: hypothetical protein PHT40_02965 [Patescibacteria group bacterium]|nr:hypothetical protein [Patescibacteria group bacterium]